MRLIQQWLVLALLATLSGCATLATRASVEVAAAALVNAIGPDGIACVGAIPQTLLGLEDASNDALVAQALGVSGKGGVCAGRAFTATQPLTVFRVYASAATGSMYGRWWSPSRPTGTRDEYRAAYAICKAWSTLDRLMSCNVKPGAQIVIGVTQNVDCDEGAYPKSPSLQIYVPNDRNTQTLLVENCVDGGVWP